MSAVPRSEQLAIPPGILAAHASPRRQVRQLDPQNSRLQRIESEVAADLFVVVLRLRTVVAQSA